MARLHTGSQHMDSPHMAHHLMDNQHMAEAMVGTAVEAMGYGRCLLMR